MDQWPATCVFQSSDGRIFAMLSLLVALAILVKCRSGSLRQNWAVSKAEFYAGNYIGTHQLKIQSLKGLSPFIHVFMLFLHQPRKACENAQHLGQKALRRAEELDSKACRWHPAQACGWQRWRKSEHKPPQSPGKMQVAQRVFPLASHVPHHCGSGRSMILKAKTHVSAASQLLCVGAGPVYPCIVFQAPHMEK